MRFVFFHRGAPFVEYSTVELDYCNGCRKRAVVLDIPQHTDVATVVSIKLCHHCLIMLANELGNLGND